MLINIKIDKKRSDILVRMYNKNLILKAKALRKNMTKQETKLWHSYLRKYSLRFRRQNPITKYIVDFYCAKAKLVVEVDGNWHYTEKMIAYDKNRSELLANVFNLKVIRFKNIDVDNNFQQVCDTIDKVVKEIIQSKR